MRRIYKTSLYFWASLIAQLVKNLPAMQEILVQFLGWEDSLENWIGYLPIPIFLGFPCSSAGKESVCNAGDFIFLEPMGRKLRGIISNET